ncbi:MAG: hypothetical protein HYZ37_12390 [Candidatus Solibacter usitatus]|nr:hypothetical protein [Candidatus Solibacter usitatus]
MSKIRLIVWNAGEAEEHAAVLRKLGHEVSATVPVGGSFGKELRASPPDLIVIGLDRLPMQGRDIALGIRAMAALKHIPIIFFGGEEEKIARIRERLPDAAYTNWKKVPDVLKRPPRMTTVAKSALDGYSGTPLAKKLGLKSGMRVFLLDEPASFFRAVDPVPEGVEWVQDGRAGFDLAIVFVAGRTTLERHLTRLLAMEHVWICWPKGKAAGITQYDVREIGLLAGLVDFKICSIDEKWSACRFRRRKENK